MRIGSISYRTIQFSKGQQRSLNRQVVEIELRFNGGLTNSDCGLVIQNRKSELEIPVNGAVAQLVER